MVPYARNLALPEEDSVALWRKEKTAGGRAASGKALRVGVVRLPHISNYTDFDPLEQGAGVSLSYLDHHQGLDGLDLLILPGTKNTISDLLYLKDTGLFQEIQAYARSGGRLVGICGGYQIMGREVLDPLGVEGPPRSEAGLGLLPVVTTMAGVKATTQVRARVLQGHTAGCSSMPMKSTWGRPVAGARDSRPLRSTAATAGQLKSWMAGSS